MPENPTKSGDGVQRTDAEPLTSRVPALTGVRSVTWYSGTLGDADVPGPSLYWIDAVVTLPDGVAGELRDTLDLTATTTPPPVVDALVPHLPAGALLTGPELDEAFSAGGWRSTAFLSSTTDELVLVIVGE